MVIEMPSGARPLLACHNCFTGEGETKCSLGFRLARPWDRAGCGEDLEGPSSARAGDYAHHNMAWAYWDQTPVRTIKWKADFVSEERG